MRLVFFGTPELAVPTLETLIAGPHEVVGVVSQPDRGRGRGRKSSPSPVARVAEREGAALLRPEKVSDPAVARDLQALDPELGVVVAYGQFVPKRIRELPSLGYMINAHASLLPLYRGAAPIQRAVLGGETETGISVMKLVREMDAGPVGLVERTPIGARENAGELADRMAELAARAIARAVDEIAAGRISWREQDHAKATSAPKLGREESRIDWSRSSRSVDLCVRGFAPKPGAWTQLGAETLRILQVEECTRRDPSAQPGTVVRASAGALEVATGDGCVAVQRLQRAGGKTLATADFLRGRRIDPGSVLV